MLIPKTKLNQILDLAKDHKVIAIGEMHGVKENPEIVFDIYTALKDKYSVTIGFEYPQSLIENPNEADEWLFKDGRFSSFHKEILRKLKLDKVKTFGFDLSTNQYEDHKEKNVGWRDKIMAENVNSKLKNISKETKLLLVMGNMHYRTIPQFIMIPNKEGESKPATLLPMGAQLNTDSILAIHLSYLSGQFYNFSLRHIQTGNFDRKSSFRDLDDVIEIDIPEAHPTKIVPF